MRITTKGRYALRAMANLAATSQGKPKPIKTIAKEEEISPEFLEQIFFKLKKAGVIESVRGPGGGFIFHRDPAGITIKEIFLAVEEGLDLTPCTVCAVQAGEEPCVRIEECIVHAIWKDISDHVVSYLDGITLAAVLERNKDKINRLLERTGQARAD
ncbi:MAG: Rrf2 family transcriptional regulator [Spirochaetaceae bacterium]|nr:MAG: Rrf2 family transcriptional regulator [Spirochaetaceae bacterium]